MNRRFIVFSSELDDGELFCTAAGDLWKGFGTDYKRFVVHLNEDQQGNLYCWKDLPEAWDLLMIWEPPVSTQNFSLQGYEQYLAEISAECVSSDIENTTSYAIYHNSSQENCRQIQEEFVQGLAPGGIVSEYASYSHIKSDGLYQSIAAILSCGWNTAEAEEYGQCLKGVVRAWPQRDLPYLSMLTLLTDMSIQAMKNKPHEIDVKRAWAKAMQGTTAEDIYQGLTEELWGLRKNRCTEIMNLLTKVQSEHDLTPEMLRNANQEVHRVWAQIRSIV